MKATLWAPAVVPIRCGAMVMSPAALADRVLLKVVSARVRRTVESASDPRNARLSPA
ncbi:hypothetical protein D3C84_1278710 [compost metagenome]